MFRYSNTIIKNHTNARRKEPKAKEPKLYLIVHLSPVVIDTFPLESDVLVKYHMHVATITTYCVQAMTSAAIQSNPKT